MNSVPVDLQSPTYTPRKLLEEVMWVLHCKNRTELANALGVDSGLICRFWNLKDPLTDGMFVRIMDRTGWSLAYVRGLTGVPYDGDTYPPRPRTIVLTALPESTRGNSRARKDAQARTNLLQAMPGTLEELAKKSGYSLDWVKKLVRRMRAGEPATRESHIEDWLPPTGKNGGGPYTAIHAAGPGEDYIPILLHRRDRLRQAVHGKLRFAPHNTAQHRAG